MTEKQTKIIQAALELFANEGYSATSTSKVAQHAGVSEGLIFRHFKNKEGLLEAIILQGEEQLKILFADIVMEPDPKQVIRKTIDLAHKATKNDSEAHFWKLQYKIKWETETYGEHKVKPLEEALIHALKKLNYKRPKMEARNLLMVLDGMAMQYFLTQNFDLKKFTSFLKDKYSN